MRFLAANSTNVVSVVRLRLQNMRADSVISRLTSILPGVKDSLESGAIVVVEDGPHRVRNLPIGD